MTGINRNVGGIRDEAVFGYVLILLASGYLLGWRFAAVYTLASIAALWWLAFLEMNETFVPVVDNPKGTARDLTVIFILIFLVVYFLIRMLTNALENAQSELSERIRIEAEREGLISRLSEEIAERKITQKELQQLARTDPLTGLINRRHFFEIAGKEFAKSVRNSRPLSVIILDLDLFKKINDTYGHLVGDQALIHIGNLLLKKARESDLPVRYGGEEFVVLLPETNLERPEIFAEHLRKIVEDSPIHYDNASISLTVSIGVAGIENTPSEYTLEQLISQSDQALYQARRTGRNRVVCVHEEGG